MPEVSDEPPNDQESRRQAGGGQVPAVAVRETVHELNNLLTIIRGYAQLAAGRSGDERTRDAIEEIQRAAGLAAVVTAGLYKLTNADDFDGSEGA